MRVCLASPERGGGIGVYLRALEDTLSAAGHEVVVLEPAPLPDPGALGLHGSHHHAWSASLLDAIEAHYGDDGPDLIEFPDYGGGACVALQARRAGRPCLRRATIAVRAHTSWELTMLLDGHLARDLPHRVDVAVEREALRGADVLLWGGGDVLGTYRRYYGELAPARRIRHPLPAAAPVRRAAGDGPLELLYVGRLERRKGVVELVEGLRRDGTDAWRLTLVGGDTPTAPGGLSLRAELELLAAGDERIAFAGELPAAGVQEQLGSAHALVMPSRWECWPYAVLEALRAGVPVLATPTGGLVELVQDGVTGWLTEGATPRDLHAGLARVLAGPPPGDGGAHVAALTDPEQIAHDYEALVEDHVPAAPAPRRSGALVTAVVPYFAAADHVEEAVASLLAQTHAELEVLVVDDGSLDPADRVLGALAGEDRVRVVHKVNGGVGSARNLGVALARGAYVLPLDADNALEPGFVARALALLEADGDLAYVTSWSRYVGPAGEDLRDGYRPLGNRDEAVEHGNVAGDAAALFPRHVLEAFPYAEDVPAFEDWLLYRTLRRAGRFGAVMPEPLLRYRVRPGSMLRQVEDPARLEAELASHLDREEMAWTAPGR